MSDMNKIVVDKKEFVVDGIKAILEINDEVELICYGSNELWIEGSSKKITIVLEDDSKLELDLSLIDYELHIKQMNNTRLELANSFLSKKDCYVEINDYLLGNDNYASIKLRCVSKMGEARIKVQAIANKDTKDNVVEEEIKGINMGGSILIEPNLEIDTFDIMANHASTISSIPEDDLFYLQSRGLSEAEAVKLIVEGFLKSIRKNKEEVNFDV